jgi:tetratricopeptide (TPR) repeat protein
VRGCIASDENGSQKPGFLDVSPPPSTPGETDRERIALLGLVSELQGALARGDRARTVNLIRQLVVREAPMGEQWPQLAGIAAELGEVTLARHAIGRFVEAQGGRPRARYAEFDLLARIGALEEARALLETLPDDVPDRTVNAYSRGAIAAFLGQAEEARRSFERATQLRPAMGEVWLPLSALVDFAAEPELAERLFAAERHIDAAAPALRAMYYYALGKAHADRGEHGRAFEALAGAAQIMKSRVAYSRDEDRANATDALRGYDGGLAPSGDAQRDGAERTIFVTGLPRSGTTLVEQILTAHSAVAGGAELNLTRVLRQEIGGLAKPEFDDYVERHGRECAQHLWRHWLHERFPEPGRVVDKSLDGGYSLGLVASLLPEAPLVWLTRDPLDCAWSCFRTHFFAGLEWSYDLEDIAFHFVLHDELLARWRELLGARLLVVPYEELVAAPEDWIRRIIAHCGLAEEPHVFAPHENRRPVTTSSLMQVRRPINRQGIGAAEPYREFLKPFIEAYYG